MDSKSKEIVSAIVVTSRVKDYLEPCLASLKAQTYVNTEIILIDNSSCVLGSPRNLSYCASLNKGINLSKGNFILCLNDDVVLDKRFIEEGLKGFLLDPRIGMVSAKILRGDGKTIDSAGLCLSLFRTAKERGYSLKDEGQFEKKEYVFGVNGAAAFYRKEMLAGIKQGADYFDAGFGFFYEDLDIAWRAQNAGWKGYYIPQAKAYHIRGGSVRQAKGIGKKYARHYLNDTLHLDLIKNRYLAMIKNESLLNFFAHLPAILLYDFALWSYILFFRPWLIVKFLPKLKYLKIALHQRYNQTFP